MKNGLPIVRRELSVASRQRNTYFGRLIAALVAVLLGIFVFCVFQERTPQLLGLRLFECIGSFAFLCCHLAGFRTADCISSERRGGTLGLLFLTDLGGSDVVLGKLVAHSLGGLYALIAIVPILAISFLTGGVSGGEWMALVIILLNTLWFSLCVGILVSSIVQNPWAATCGTFLVYAVFSVGLIILAEEAFPRELRPFIKAPSPTRSMEILYSNMRAGGWTELAPNLLCVHFLGWLALIGAIVITPRNWRDQGTVRISIWRREFFLLVRKKLPRLSYQRIFLRVNPYYWLTTRDPLKARLVWMFVTLASIFWLGRTVLANNWVDNEDEFILFALFSHSLFKVWVGAEACNRLANDKSSGALELLLSTPIRIREIVYGQRRALFRQFWPAIVFILLLDTIFLVAWYGNRRSDDAIQAFFAGTSNFLVDLAAIYWVGMWLGLKTGSVARCLLAFMVQFFALPLGLFIFWVIFRETTRKILGRFSGDEALWSWWAISIATSLWFGLRARNQIWRNFRAVAAGEIRRKRFDLGALIFREPKIQKPNPSSSHASIC